MPRAALRRGLPRFSLRFFFYMSSFIIKITFQHITPRCVASIGPIVAEMALAEDLHAHRLAMALRLDHLTEQ